MKDIVITGRRLRIEGYVFLGCFVAALLLNVAAIIVYERPFTELFITIGYELVITVTLYALTVFFRVIAYLAGRLFRR